MQPLHFAVVLVTALTVAAYVQQAAADHAPNHIAAKKAATLSDGEVRKVDKDAQKITIRHGPIQNLDMPAMTMVFQVKDASMLDRVRAGGKIKFYAERIGGAFTVTQIEAED